MLTSAHLLAGTPVVPPTPTPLKRGALSVEFEDGALRNIRLGDTLVLQRIYSAVRDQNWATISGVVRLISEERTDTEIKIVFECAHQQNDIDFIWTGTVHLTASEVAFDMEGVAMSSFKRNRIGFCILHDSNVAGKPCIIEHIDGIKTEGAFPLDIAPHQPYLNIRSVQHAVDANTTVTVRMEGDTFEMEDQRNWSDASYKTYCTALSLSLPFPAFVESGTRIHQRIILTVSGAPASAETSMPILISRIEGETSLPALGLALADEDVPAGPRQLEALKALHLKHLRVDLEPASDTFPSKVAYAARMSHELNAPLEIALWLNDVEADLARLSEALRQTPLNIARWLVFHRPNQRTVTPGEIIEQARPGLKALSDAPIFSGTDAFFTQLNRAHPNPALIDGVTYSSNPQVHAFDNRTLIEALEIHGLQVTNAHRIVGDKPVAVSALTLKMRWNPDATAPSITPKGELPRHVDPRQMSLLTAVWTLGSIKHQAQAGAHCLTYFTTHGMDGVMDSEGGSPVPDKFPTVGGVYPVYWVFFILGSLKEARVLHTQSSHPRLVDVLEVAHANGRLIMIANYTPEPQTVMLKDMGGTYQQRHLNESIVIHAIAQPDAFHSQPIETIRSEGDLNLTLAPYGIVFLEA
jgi:D-apionolactonase